MNDIMLDRLGDYFVYHDILNKYGITFEEFIRIWERGEWCVYRST